MQKKKILLTAFMLKCSISAYAVIPLIPIFIGIIIVGGSTSIGIGAYCSSGGCKKSKESERVYTTTANPQVTTSTTANPQVTTPNSQATTTTLNPQTTTNVENITITSTNVPAPNPLVIQECNQVSRPHEPRIEIASAAVTEFENRVNNFNQTIVGERENQARQLSSQLRINACYVYTLLQRTYPETLLISLYPNEHVNTLMRISNLTNRIQNISNFLKTQTLNNGYSLAILNELQTVNDFIGSNRNLISEFLNQQLPVQTAEHRNANNTVEIQHPVVVNFRSDVLYNYRENLIEYFTYESLRVARNRFQEGLNNGTIQSDVVTGRFTARINQIFQQNEENIRSQVSQYIRALLNRQENSLDRNIDWNVALNQGIEFVLRQYDYYFSVITCVDWNKTEAYQNTCRQYERRE
nr:hypothetical protein GTC16762_10580 [Pigmentibacter ruber]